MYSGGKATSSGEIVIKGGNIKAKGTYGAGIGGAWQGYGYIIEISGGTISAESDKGAGIGGGDNGVSGPYGNSGIITISGGYVKSKTSQGAGIGSGMYGPCNSITIDGGTVISQSITGAGIGGGQNANGGDVIITGGSVIAKTEGIYAKPIGRGNAGRNDGTLKNGLEDVYPTTIILDGIYQVTKIYDVVGLPDYYKLTDVYTDESGTVCFYLPAECTIKAVHSELYKHEGVAVTGDTKRFFAKFSWPNNSCLNATDIRDTTLTLSWNSMGALFDIKNYVVYMVVNPDENVLIAAVDPNTLYYTVTGLNPETTYNFKVEALSSDDILSTDGPHLSISTTFKSPTWPEGSLLT